MRSLKHFMLSGEPDWRSDNRLFKVDSFIISMSFMFLFLLGLAQVELALFFGFAFCF